jgi:glycerol-3-phosphate dehydrogenase (NAD(P)+)
MKKQIAVLGGGCFGTALANLIADNHYSVNLWLRDDSIASEIRQYHENKHYLPGVSLNPTMQVTSDINSAVADADAVFFAIPSTAFREVVRRTRPHIKDKTLLISTTKGIEKASFKLMSEVLAEETQSRHIGVLSGPNLAKEMAQRMLTGTVVASDDIALMQTVREILSCSYFRVYVNADRYGVELGGALKNTYAIATGMASALGMGENTKSMLITRSLAEMSRFAAYTGGNPLTFLGLSGVGDLVTTCMSPLSRNFQMGYALGQGKTLAAAQESIGQVAEGVNTIELVYNKARELGIYMPLIQGLYAIIYEHQPLQAVISRLMLGEQGNDVDFVVDRMPLAAT